MSLTKHRWYTCIAGLLKRLIETAIHIRSHFQSRYTRTPRFSFNICLLQQRLGGVRGVSAARRGLKRRDNLPQACQAERRAHRQLLHLQPTAAQPIHLCRKPILPRLWALCPACECLSLRFEPCRATETPLTSPSGASGACIRLARTKYIGSPKLVNFCPEWPVFNAFPWGIF